MGIILSDATQLHQVNWPNTPDGILARNALKPLLEHGAKYYIANVQTKLLVLQIDQLILPVTVNDKEYDNSYVCSPYSHYFSYAKTELKLLKNKPLEFCLNILLNLIGLFFRFCKINKTVIVNSWLFSTNLYPEMTQNQIERISVELKKQFPEHSICFRSIHTYGDKNLFDYFLTKDFKKVGSRQVYFFDARNPASFRGKSYKTDLKLYRSREKDIFGMENIQPNEYSRIIEIYNALYINKHSQLNPQFTEKFIELAMKSKILELKIVRNEHGIIEGVVGFYVRNGVMTTPLLGYDTSQPIERGLYRLLTYILSIEARDRGLLLHRSSGAASFKKSRGSTPCMEYSAICYQHLSFRQRFVWDVLALLVNKIGIPLLEKQEL